MPIFDKARRAAEDAAKKLIQQAAQFGQAREQQKPQASTGREEISVWDPRARLVDLTGYGDWLSLGDMFTGLSVFGGTGSGKTSSIAIIAVYLMEMECGFVWLCAKPDEVRLVKRLARAAGREHDVIIIGEDEDGEITGEHFNPLDYESNVPRAGTGAVVKYLADSNKVLSREEGTRNGGGDSRFWDTQFERLLRYCIDTAKLAGRPLSVDLLRLIQLSAPASAENLADDAWVEKSACMQCLYEAEARAERGEIAEEDFNRVWSFWKSDYMALDSKPRSTIDVMFAALTDSFSAEEPLRSILTKDTTVTPDDVIENGKIVVCSLPTSVYHEAGRMAQFCFKYSFQRAMLRRRKPEDGSHVRPTVLWADEAHNFAHEFDARYFAEVRSNRGINVYLEQSIGGYMDALGAQNPRQVGNFLANLATKFYFQNSDPDTNEFGADATGRMMVEQKGESTTISEGGYSQGKNRHEIERHQVLSGDFIQLRRGGPENNKEVDFIVAKPAIFNQTGTNWARHYFTQTDLTR